MARSPSLVMGSMGSMDKLMGPMGRIPLRVEPSLSVALTLLGVYDTLGDLTTTGMSLVVPAGATLAVARCVGASGGSQYYQTSAPHGNGTAYQRYYPGGSGGAFSKRSFAVGAGDKLAVTNTQPASGYGGTGLLHGSTLVAFAEAGQSLNQQNASTQGGRGFSPYSIGDVTRGGGNGAAASGNGGDGDHGATGTLGGTYYQGAGAGFPSDDYSNNYVGGRGGIGGDFGDVDGIGIGWNTVTALRYDASKNGQDNRVVVQYYGSK